MSAALYEKIGRMHEQLEVLNASYDALLKVFAQVVGGEINRARVLVNLTERSWGYCPAGERPATPSTINGLPQIVVADTDDKETIQRLEHALKAMGVIKRDDMVPPNEPAPLLNGDIKE